MSDKWTEMLTKLAKNMPISNQQSSRKITIPAGREKTISFQGSYIAVLSNSTSTDVHVSADNGIVSPVRAGSGYDCVRSTPDNSTHIPAVYKRVTFSNPLEDTVMVVEYVLSKGHVDLPSIINGYLYVNVAGEPDPRGWEVADTVAGLSIELYNNCMGVMIYVDAVAPVEVWKDGKFVCRRPANSTCALPFRNCTILLKGDGANANVAVTPVEAAQ